MKIALFSDVHANLPALEAFFADLDTRNVDAVYCLGDLVGYNCWPNEVIRLIRKRHIPTIAGNYDYGIGRSSNECGCAYKTDIDKEMGKISIAYTNQLVGQEERQYLRCLPAHLNLEFQLQHASMNLLLVHGSPRKNNEYLFEDREEQSTLRILQQANAHILCFGHTHQPYHRILSAAIDDQMHHWHAINTGSVGKPKDGNPQGGYVIIELNENTNPLNPASLQVSFIRFNYDISRAVDAIKASPLPDAYANMLINGG